jgi:glucokinase
MKRYMIGIDLGGTKIAAALVDDRGRVYHEMTMLTHAEEGLTPVIDRMEVCLQTLLDQADAPVAGIGIGAAGMVDSVHGIVIQASNLNWQAVPLRQLILDRIGRDWVNRVWVDKDTNAAVLGESLYGAGQGCKHLLYVTVGTGIGGGMMLEGHLYHGATQGASDIGHLVLNKSGQLCGCGKRGCLETLASGPAIVRMTLERIAAGEASLQAKLDPQILTARDVVEAAQLGDELGRSVLAEAGEWLGMGLAYYVEINNPERIIIGGGVAAAGELLLGPVRQAIAKWALPANAKAACVVMAGLGAESGVVGAATLGFSVLSLPPPHA